MELEQHLKDRHCDVSLYRPVLDHQEGVVTFYLWNLSGQLIGYQRYRPFAPKSGAPQEEMRYFTKLGREGEREGIVAARYKIGVFGLEAFNRPGPLFIVEGIFDAVRLHNRGLAAIAVLANDPKAFKSWVSSLGRTTIAICDNDSAGKKLAKIADTSIICWNKDLGDMTEKELVYFLEEHDIVSK
jgi:hypothetical protein